MSITKTVGTLVHGANHTVAWRIVARLAIGSVPATGLTLTISSVGAGAIGGTVLLLLLLYPKLPMARIVGSDIAHAVPLTLVAGMGHWYLGSLDMAILASLLPGSIPGIVPGSLFALRVPEKVLRPILAATLALVGGTLVF